MNRCPRCRTQLHALDAGTGLRICASCRGGAIAQARVPLPPAAWRRDVVAEIEIEAAPANESADVWRSQSGALSQLQELSVDEGERVARAGEIFCVDCAIPLEKHLLRASESYPEETLFLCRRCEHMWLEAGVFARLEKRGGAPRASSAILMRAPTAATRAAAMRPAATQTATTQIATTTSTTTVHDSTPIHERMRAGDDVLRIPMNEPLSRIAALPVAFAIAALMQLTNLGTLLLFPFAIQFHEFGHATFAWLSGRFAVPIPCGFTLWFEAQPWFFEMPLIALFGFLGYVAVREKRIGFGLLVAFFACAHLYLRAMAPDRSLGLAVAGGFVGEIVFPTITLLFFPIALPQRVRWDFFRYLFVLPAAGTLELSYSIWSRALREGGEALPRGSFMGSGGGDIERLIGDFDYAESSLAPFFLRAVQFAFLLIAISYTIAVMPAVRDLYRRRQLR